MGAATSRIAACTIATLRISLLSRNVPDQLVGSSQASKAIIVETSRWHSLGLINQVLCQIAAIPEQTCEFFKHLFIRNTPCRREKLESTRLKSDQSVRC